MQLESILKDWQKEFPVLSKYTSTSLAVRSEIFLIVLRLDKVLSDSYRPILEIHPLWKTNKREINIPFLSFELLDNKNRQFFIKYQIHADLFNLAVECSKKQFGFMLHKEISVGDVLKLISLYTKTAFVTKHNPINWFRIFELKLALAIFINKPSLTDAVKTEIERETNYWDEKRFYSLFGSSINEWKTNLYERIGNREIFMEQVCLNINDRKISKLGNIHIKQDDQLTTPSMFFKNKFIGFIHKHIFNKNE